MAENKLRKRTDKFVIVSSTTIRNARMSFRARGLLSFVLDLPEGWDVRSEWLATQGTEGREAIRSALREMAEHGHYRLERRRLRSGRFEMASSISDHPVPAWATEAAEFDFKAVPMVEQPDGSFLVKHKDGTLTDDGFPKPDESANEDQCSDQVELDVSAGQTEDGFPGSGKPGSGSPDVGIPDAGFLGPFSNTETHHREVLNPELPPTSGAPRSGQPDLADEEDARRRKAVTDAESERHGFKSRDVTASPPPGQLDLVEELPEPKAKPQRQAKPQTKAQAARTPEQQAAFDAADKISRLWWDRECPRLGIPVTPHDRRRFPGFRDHIQALLLAPCTPEEIALALTTCKDTWPTKSAINKAIGKQRRDGTGAKPSPGDDRIAAMQALKDPEPGQYDDYDHHNTIRGELVR